MLIFENSQEVSRAAQNALTKCSCWPGVWDPCSIWTAYNDHAMSPL